MGAGVLPFCVKDGQIHFLFQTVFSGRKTGYFNDFGGGSDRGESYRATAIREFIEETETMFFASDITQTVKSEQTVMAQIPQLTQLFDKTLEAHPDWWCQRKTVDPNKPKDWKTFFIELDYKDVSAMNWEWENDQNQRFSKRRKLIWISAADVCHYFEYEPEKLWKRVRQLENAIPTIQSIVNNYHG